jgi:hypothetical protein
MQLNYLFMVNFHHFVNIKWGPSTSTKDCFIKKTKKISFIFLNDTILQWVLGLVAKI